MFYTQASYGDEVQVPFAVNQFETTVVRVIECLDKVAGGIFYGFRKDYHPAVFRVSSGYLPDVIRL